MAQQRTTQHNAETRDNPPRSSTHTTQRKPQFATRTSIPGSMLHDRIQRRQDNGKQPIKKKCRQYSGNKCAVRSVQTTHKIARIAIALARSFSIKEDNNRRGVCSCIYQHQQHAHHAYNSVSTTRS